MNRFCVIGGGNHTTEKIIPAIRESRNTLVGLVTSKKDIDYESVSIFDNIDEAVKKLDQEVIFFLSTPPLTHYDMAKYLLSNNYSVMIEKPIFLYSRELDNIEKIISGKQIFFYECFMYQFGLMYHKFKKIFKENINNIKQISISFCLPQVPKNTFRTDNKISSSLLYDIGCYPISLLNIIGLKEKSLNITKIINKGNFSRECFQIDGNSNGIKIKINIGIKARYSNYVIFNLDQNRKITFSPFFYGRKIKKVITYEDNNHKEEEFINDKNLFIEMLNFKKEKMIYSQLKRSKDIKLNLSDLENLIYQYNEFI